MQPELHPVDADPLDLNAVRLPFAERVADLEHWPAWTLGPCRAGAALVVAGGARAAGAVGALAEERGLRAGAEQPDPLRAVRLAQHHRLRQPVGAGREEDGPRAVGGEVEALGEGLAAGRHAVADEAAARVGRVDAPALMPRAGRADGLRGVHGSGGGHGLPMRRRAEHQ